MRDNLSSILAEALACINPGANQRVQGPFRIITNNVHNIGPRGMKSCRMISLIFITVEVTFLTHRALLCTFSL